MNSKTGFQDFTRNKNEIEINFETVMVWARSKVITWRYEAKDCVAILVLLLLQVMGLQISHLLTRTLGMSIY